MRDLAGRVAVVTGAASGIGRGLAERFAAEGMKVVLADVEEAALATAGEELAATGADVLAVRTDVASRASVAALAEASVARFGAVHVLCNNAGVAGGPGPLWRTTEADWQWVLGVNLMGVVHGIQSFVPGMVANGQPGHIVNTSSVLGLSSGGGSIYAVSKHAVTRLSEGLYHDLRAAGAALGVSVLCPGMVATRIVSADRNRPPHLRDAGVEVAPEIVEQRRTMQERFLASGMPPAEVAGMVVDAIRADRFYVLTHPRMIRRHIRARLQAVLDGAPPAGGLTTDDAGDDAGDAGSGDRPDPRRST
jgi:NAD(P)-dependent dehydrogenase (short-subunit alcohol dehydrogenase family)